MSIHFVWDDKYSVGNPEIDAQHQGLFELGNKLSEVLEGQEVNPVVMRLYKYTREHFLLEEEMMRSIGFPLYEEHKILHENLISELNEISASPFDSEESVLKFKKFVYDWLIDHILNKDMLYFEFSQKKR